MSENENVFGKVVDKFNLQQAVYLYRYDIVYFANILLVVSFGHNAFLL